jgi:uncharacterized protein
MIGQLNKDEIEIVLQSNAIGRLGCSDGEKVYVVPINYVYDGNFIIAHSVEGTKIRMMRKNPSVCFEVDQMKSFTNWKSVIVWGQYEELVEGPEKHEVMKSFVAKMIRMKISETAKPPEMAPHRVHPRSPGNIKPVIFRIAISEKTGRFETENG